ncbi:MAG: hypothetical protein UJ210_07495 [Massilimicrobiota sp.]|nr:hypothetical protein [Massilimicrobiota sp.]
MKKAINFVLIVAMFIILFIPLFYINTVSNAISLAENRTLAQFPHVFDENGNYNHNTKPEFTSWINDNIGFRDQMLKFNAEFQYKVFNRISSNSVILGKEDWLFYKGEGSISINDYQAKSLLSENELDMILKNVQDLNDWCNENNMDFVLMLIPNKEYIYKEYIPDSIEEINEIKNIDLIVNYIRENSDIKVVYPKEILLEGKNNHSVFYKYDTHWNHYGAYLGYVDLMNTLNMSVKSFESYNPKEVSINSGDLGGMAILQDVLKSYKDLQVSDSSECIYDDQMGNESYQKYINNQGEKNIFFMGDSFRNAMKPYLNDTFNHSNYVHRFRQNFDDAVREDTDIFVYQMVERYATGLVNPIIDMNNE